MSQWSNGSPATSGMAYAGSMVVGPRDKLDALRMGGGRLPEAEYPAGYLGTIRSRREDRLLDAVKQKLGDRSYQRGVHKGLQMDPQDYFWPAELTPDRGLQLEAQARKVNGYVYRAPARPNPIGTTTEWLLYSNRVPRGAESLVGPDPGTISEQAPELRRFLPGWR